MEQDDPAGAHHYCFWLGQICHLRACLPQPVPARHVWGGGVVPPSSVEITSISKQYWVSGQSGVCFPTRDWDGEWHEVLPKCLCHLQGHSGYSVVWWGYGPLSGTTTPDFWSSRLTQSGSHQHRNIGHKSKLWIGSFNLGAKAYARKLRNDWACASHVYFMVS